VLERLALILAMILVAATVVTVVRRQLRLRIAQLAMQDPGPLWAALGAQPDGRPTLVVFSTPSCVACRTAQEPAVNRLVTRLGSTLRVLHVDISVQLAPARAFNVLTAPSTAVLHPGGQLSNLNHGFVPAARLEQQIRTAAERPASAPSPTPQGRPALEAPASDGRR
jgi:hypothetical protein